MTDRQEWLSLLATSKPQTLAVLWADTGLAPDYVMLRKAETGSVMVRGRAGSVGKAFNLGEMTVTRCTIRTESGHTGHAYVAGRDARQAELAALADALLQDDTRRSELMSRLIAPLEQAQREQAERTARKAAATQVQFFTLATMRS